MDFLIMLENVEDILRDDIAKFQKFLERMLQDADSVKILMCSSEVTKEIMPDFSKMVPILELDPENSVRFFIDRIDRPCSEGEVLDLILEKPTEPIWELLPGNLEPNNELD